jgi:amino acid adenylation domain-containing protein
VKLGVRGGNNVIAPRADSIAARIGARAVAIPDCIAVADGSACLTYEQLNNQSNALAARLQEAGATQDSCVGIFLERSIQFVVAALAVMKSGAAYVPLDPSTPDDRVAWILADAEAIVLLTDSSRAQRVPSGAWRAIALDLLDGSNPPFKPYDIDPQSLAYIIYTSGSTGQPKGVEIPHVSLCNLIEWHQSAFGVTAADRASQVASFGFDAAVWEIWPYLEAGATLYVADEITRRSPQALRDWIVANRITIGFVPTAIAEQLIWMEWPVETALRVLLTGGDTLHHRPAPHLPFVLFNNYGPTECTVVATSGVVSPVVDGDLPTIGRPIADTKALILDDALRPVAPGQVGELCLGGLLVGRGYRNRPELTADHFVKYVPESGDPFRIYRTGDRARFLENSEILFVGRVDDQVKIRGYRIELGEIIATLNRFPGIKTNIVVVREAGDGGPTLIAYVVPAADAGLTEAGLRDYLGKHLPDYMIPTLFVLIPELPTTANGKPDKAALPVPCADNILTNSGGWTVVVANDDNGVQQRVSALVASMLGRPAIAADEDFFMLGGHSMLGVELVSRIRDSFGVRLTLRQLFTAPTVAALSAEIAQRTK